MKTKGNKNTGKMKEGVSLIMGFMLSYYVLQYDIEP
jgi:hypothetical protein